MSCNHYGFARVRVCAFNSKKLLLALVVACATGVVFNPAHAAHGPATPNSPDEGARRAAADGMGAGNLEGLGFGFALGATYFSEENVKTAVAQQNIVRVTDGDRAALGFWLELHHFWGWGTPDGKDDRGMPSYPYGLGPFLAVQLNGDRTVLQSIGVGFMVGARKEKSSTNAFNLGIGLSVSQINVLSDGLVKNQPLPSGFTDVTTKSKVVGGVFLITSFSF
jgi:hypothetical protein